MRMYMHNCATMEIIKGGVLGYQQVFDFHHHKFCPGDLTEKEAVYAAIATWPAGIRPVVHWSESQEGRKPHAHSDFIFVRPSLAHAVFTAFAAAQLFYFLQHSEQVITDVCFYSMC